MSATDTKAVYDSRTETVKTGDGRFVRVRDLYKALATLNQVQLHQLIVKARLGGAVADPYEVKRSDVVEDLVDLCRTRPQYCLPILTTCLAMPTAGPRFAKVFRDRAFGSASARDVADDHERDVADDIHFDKAIGQYFYETGKWPGEYQLFITQDQRTLTLNPRERFDSHEPYELCFVVVRTPDGRFWLKWPEHHPDTPAYYMDEHGQAVWFFPHEVEGEPLDFEELFPSYIYEVFGVQFQLPDIGTDYGVYYDDDLDAWTEWDPSDAKRRAVTGGERAHGDAAEAPRAVGELERLLAILDLKPGEISSAKALSRHFRKLSVQVHPLKHLDAPDAEKIRIAARYQEITTAYNELKLYFS
jgi:hypothetical protein